MIYLYEYCISGIGDHPLSGHHASRIIAQSDEEAIDKIEQIKKEFLKEFDGSAKYTVLYIYKDTKSDVVKNYLKKQEE